MPGSATSASAPTIGKFDPNFWPVYHEDYDYMVRTQGRSLLEVLAP